MGENTIPELWPKQLKNPVAKNWDKEVNSWSKFKRENHEFIFRNTEVKMLNRFKQWNFCQLDRYVSPEFIR